ncbi:DUF4038 domain-containing protein [Arthrobacter sp. LFS091]|uniref:apiosidase-like domain-containing protein n=1 Tax=Arthrobacter sp. LFS091 TaxID=3229892 RepID=UPI003A810A97
MSDKTIVGHAQPALSPLTVSADGRRLVTIQGEPFFYLADTAWTLPQRLKWDDALYYMNKRRMQGFTVIQIVALDPERDVDMRDPAGNSALQGGDLSKPNEAYFQYLDRLVQAAQDMGLYVMLLPVWGQLVVGESWGGSTFPETVTENNAYDFGRWIGARYRDRPHIIWCLGGDRQPIHKGIDYRPVWRRMAEGLANGVTGQNPRWDESSPAWRNLIITYHTCFEMETNEFSTMSYWSDDEAWISLILLQSGHGLITASYWQVRAEYERSNPMPVLDAEPAYEQMPMNWPQLFPLHGDWIVRKRAYWSVLAGAFGHTYGHASVWCMISEKERNEVLSASWYEALTHPGAEQMTILRDFVESLSFERWVPAQSMVAHNAKCGHTCLDQHRQAALDRNGEFAIVYLTDGGSERVNLAYLSTPDVLGVWFNPRTAETTEPFDVRREPHGNLFEAPTQGPEQDWLLVLATNRDRLLRLSVRRTWANPLPSDDMSMIWAE